MRDRRVEFYDATAKARRDRRLHSQWAADRALLERRVRDQLARETRAAVTRSPQRGRFVGRPIDDDE
ncbi:hypothetical protein ABQE93_20880 [Mycolicibacterium sp. XJ662]